MIFQTYYVAQPKGINKTNKSQPNKKQIDAFKMEKFTLVLAGLTYVKTMKACLISFICTQSTIQDSKVSSKITYGKLYKVYIQ